MLIRDRRPFVARRPHGVVAHVELGLVDRHRSPSRIRRPDWSSTNTRGIRDASQRRCRLRLEYPPRWRWRTCLNLGSWCPSTSPGQRSRYCDLRSCRKRSQRQSNKWLPERPMQRLRTWRALRARRTASLPTWAWCLLSRDELCGRGVQLVCLELLPKVPVGRPLAQIPF